jgi:hypothetical protein
MCVNWFSEVSVPLRLTYCLQISLGLRVYKSVLYYLYPIKEEKPAEIEILDISGKVKQVPHQNPEEILALLFIYAPNIKS